MRALHVLRPDARVQPGGDVMHAEAVACALRVRGVQVDTVATDRPAAAGYDVAHVFGIFEPEVAARQCAAVCAAHVPLVLSPIWLDLGPFFAVAPLVEDALRARTRAGTGHRLAAVRRRCAAIAARGAPRAARRRVEAQRALVHGADVLLPASRGEAALYVKQLGAAHVPTLVARLGVDPAAFAPPDEARTGVLCAAARIESKKNQAALLYALHDVDVDVTIAGRAHDERYFALCRRWATRRTHFAGVLEPQDLRALMARAAVHAHASWFESPGLASMEAAAGGAHIVVGYRGTEREYFGPDADYADPADPAAIRAAVLRALARPPRARGDALERRLRALTWDANAAATHAAYERAVAGAS